jgi:hypothetical protein
VAPVALTSHQLLYYDHLLTSKLEKRLHTVSLFAGSHDMMSLYLKSESDIMEVGPNLLPPGGKLEEHSGKISTLAKRISDGDLVFTSHPHLVDSFLDPGTRTLISGTDGREFSTSHIHLLDSWSISKIRDLLSVVRSSGRLKITLYVSYHPHTTSVDAAAYIELSQKLGEIDSMYRDGRQSALVQLQE